MSDIGFLVRELIDAGAPPEVAAEMIARAFVAGTQAATVRSRSAGAERQARYRERNKASLVTDVTDSDAPSLPPVPPSPSPTPPSPTPLTPQPNPNLVPGKPGRVLKFRKPEYPPEFQMLWDVFPKHPNASKSEALRRWEQLDPVDRDNCLTGAMRYEDFLTAERRKRPDYPGLHLATFIHQRRWEAHLEAAE
jgi:hypothetical protein